MKLINKKFNMYSCKPSELTYRQMKMLDQAFDDESKTLADFQSFFDDKEGKLILNEEHPYYENLVRNYIAYLECDKKMRAEIHDDIKTDFWKEVAEHLDIVSVKMEKYKIKNLLSLQNGSENAYKIWGILSEDNKMMLMDKIMYVYNYGLINGKRQERAKFKKFKRRNEGILKEALNGMRG